MNFCHSAIFSSIRTTIFTITSSQTTHTFHFHSHFLSQPTSTYLISVIRHSWWRSMDRNVLSISWWQVLCCDKLDKLIILHMSVRTGGSLPEARRPWWIKLSFSTKLKYNYTAITHGSLTRPAISLHEGPRISVAPEMNHAPGSYVYTMGV